jgi:hypothetical protein
MLYYLFNYLDQLDFPGAGMFKYVSFRSALALILSLFISTAIGRRIIDKLQMLQIGETVRNLGLEGQMSKKGTPTMGGIIIIIAIVVPTLLCAKLTNIYVILMLVTTIWLGALGFADDYIKVFRKNKEGMHGKFKIIGQIGLGLIVGLVLFMSPDVVIKENMEVRHDNVIEEVRYHTVEKKSTKTTIPFVKNNNFDYAQLVNWAGEYKEEAAWLVFVLMVIFVERGEPDRRAGWPGGGKLGDYRGGTRNTCVYVVALRVRLFPEYHVHPRSGRTGGVCGCLYRGNGRILVVQCLSGTGVYG